MQAEQEEPSKENERPKRKEANQEESHTLGGKEIGVHEEKIPTVFNAAKESSKVAEKCPYCAICTH